MNQHGEADCFPTLVSFPLQTHGSSPKLSCERMSALIKSEPSCLDEVLGCEALLPVARGLVCGMCRVCELGSRYISKREEKKDRRSFQRACALRLAGSDLQHMARRACLQDGGRPRLLLVVNAAAGAKWKVRNWAARSAERGTGNRWAECPALPSPGGQGFTLKQCFVNPVHKADALHPKKKIPNRWSSPALLSRRLCSAKSGRSKEGACVGAAPGAGTSRPLLLQGPGAFASPPALGMRWCGHVPSLGLGACLASKDSANSI